MLGSFARSQGLIRSHGSRLTRSLLVGAMALGATVVSLGLSSPAGASSPTVSAGNGPIGVAVNPLTNTVYVANQNGNSVSVINGSTNTVTSTVSVGSNPCLLYTSPSPRD